MHYWRRVRDEAGRLGSDGCTMTFGTYRDCCFEHDIAYRTGATVDGQCLTQQEADLRFRSCIQAHSIFGWFSPVAWVRWWVLCCVGHIAWEENATERRRHEPLSKEMD